MMNSHDFSRSQEAFAKRIAVARRRVDALARRPQAPPAQREEALNEALVDLCTTLEELQICAEEQRAQNAELLSTRQLVEAERQRYQELFDLAPDGYLVTDAAGIIEEANFAAEALLSRRREHLTGKPLASLIAETERPVFRHQLSRLRRVSHESVQPFAVRLRQNGGGWLDVELVVTAARDQNGKATRLRWLLRDVSVRAQAERAVRETAAKARAILEAAVDGIITIDERGAISSLNSAAARLFGYAPEELIGRNVRVLMPPPYRTEHDDYLARYRETGVKKIIGIGREVIGQRKDGSVFPMDLSVTEAHLGDRRLFTGMVRDLTERKQSEQAVRFHAFMDNSPAVQWVKDEAGRYVYINATYERVFRQTLAGIRGKTDFDVFPPDVASNLRAADVRALESNRTVELFENVPAPDGGPSEWITFKFPFTGPAGRRFVGGVAIDVTERKRAEAKVRELEQLWQQRQRLADIGAITAQIVHDVGNPLAGISMQAQLILHRVQRDANQPVSTIAKPAERIFAEVGRLDSLVKEFMEFSHEQRLDLKPVRLAPFVQHVAELWQPVAAERGIEFTIEAVPELPALTADEEKMHRVLDNLVKNAIEAIGQGPGQVAIQVALPAPDTVTFIVLDTGPGISERVQVFRLFETTKLNGSGIGLAVARQIVLAHHGTIEFAPRHPHGTIFRIELPRGGPLS
jgi:two-component system sensor kinase FixL